ncbi:MAG: hypothetical protein ACPGSC_12680 [Granulosicoccaceae bacterium]
MSPTISLKEALKAAQGQPVDALAQLYRTHADDSDFQARLLSCLRQATPLIEATWLLKHHLEQGHRLQASKLVAVLDKLSHAESKLHALQCFDKLDIGAADQAALEAFCRHCLLVEHKFVRAWAYSGFAHLARRFPELAAEAEQLLACALEHEVPSVKARIRQITALKH